MNQKAKRILIFVGLGIDIAITVSLFVIAIIMLATMPSTRIEMEEAVSINGPFIGYLQQNPTLYLCACVIPLFVLLAANIIILILYVRKVMKKKAMAVDDLSEEQKAALRAELMKELQAEDSENKKEEDNDISR